MCNSGPYIVFFDWDKATLTDRARGVVKEAAEASTRVAYTRIEVNGFTDTSGTKQHNQGLSVRRAQAVAAQMIRDGVPANHLYIVADPEAFGNTSLGKEDASVVDRKVTIFFSR